MKTVFFEIADWEKEELTKSFPDAIFEKEKLTIENADKFKGVEIASCFIYSDFSKQVIEKLPLLKFISTRSTGYDHIDLSFCSSKSINVSNVPEYGSRTVAEHTFALILTLAKKIYQSINQAKSFEFDHKNIRSFDLFGKTIGIVGLGKIGLEVIKIAKGFGMNVIISTRTRNEEVARTYQAEFVDLNTLLSRSDIVSLHLPYSKATHHIINKENIKLFKKGSLLINTARGGLIETEALVTGLSQNILEGIGLDVLEEEKELGEEVEILTSSFHQTIDLKTLVLDHVLINHPKVVITPHNAFNSREALARITETTIENIKNFIENNPKNLL